jgi:hypothetical protein
MTTELDRELCGRVAQLVEERLDPKYRRVVQALAIVGVLVVAGCLTGWLFISNEAENRADAIQASRYESWIENCQEINARNQHGREVQARYDLLPRNREAVTEFIDAIAPPRSDCQAYARQKTADP